MKKLALFVALFAAGCTSTPTDADRLAVDARRPLDVEPRRQNPGTLLDPIVQVEPFTPTLLRAIELDPLGTESCGDLEVYDLSNPRNRQPNGNYRLAGAVPTGRHFTEVCPQSLETLTRGPEVVARFTARVAGRHAFEATGVTHLYALDACSSEAEPVECASIPHYHSPEFAREPRRVWLDLDVGQTVYLVLDSMNSSSMNITAHTPFEEGQYCVVNTNGWIQRRCHTDLWCDSANEDREARVCRPRLAPVVTDAWVAFTGGDIYATATGTDPDANAYRLSVEFLDRRGQTVPVGNLGVEQVVTRTPAGFESDGTEFFLPGAAVEVGSLGLDRAVRARVRVLDLTGAVSEPLEVLLGRRELHTEGERCDPVRIESACEAGLTCGVAGVCVPWSYNVRSDGESLAFEAVADTGERDTSELAVTFTVDADDWRFSIRDSDLSDRRFGWHLKRGLAVPTGRDTIITMAPGTPAGGRDGSVTVTPVGFERLVAGAGCDGDRVMDRCPEATACRQDRQGFRCLDISAPTLTQARVFWEGRGLLGLEVVGEDPDDDVVSFVVTPVVESPRPYTRAFDREWGAEHGTLVRGDGAFEGAYSLRFYSTAEAFDVAVVDAEGLVSEPVRAVLAERATGQLGDACDLLGVRVACPEPAFCDRRDDQDSYRCQEPVSACPDDWEVTPLTLGNEGSLTVQGNTDGAPNHTTSSCTSDNNWQDAPEDIYSFVAPRDGWYQIWVESDAFRLFDVALRRHCAHPRRGASELACTDDADWHAAYAQTGLQLEEGERVYLFVERADRDDTGRYELTISW